MRNSRKPRYGTNTTAANHDSTSASAVTAKMPKVYSPTVERASPTGKKPVAVMSVPVSIGMAVELYAKVAASILEKPSSSLRTIISTAMIASSTSRPSAMISAPSEILCRPMSKMFMNRNVTASTSGIVKPTTRPGHTSMRSFGLVCRPSERKLTASTITTASISTCTNSPTEFCTDFGWFCTCSISMPIGSFARILSTVARRSLPSWMMSPPLVIEMPRPMTSLPL